MFFVQGAAGVILACGDGEVVACIQADVALGVERTVFDGEVVTGVQVDVLPGVKGAAGGGDLLLLVVGFRLGKAYREAGTALVTGEGGAHLLVLGDVVEGVGVFGGGDDNVVGIHANVAPGIHLAARNSGVVACLDGDILTGIEAAAPRLGGLALVGVAGGGLPEEGAAARAYVVHGVHGLHHVTGVAHGVVATAQVADGIGGVAQVVVEGERQAIAGEAVLGAGGDAFVAGKDVDVIVGGEAGL